MSQNRVTYTQLGMLFGIFIGAGVGVILFSTTNNPVWLGAVGVGLVIGLILGTGLDRRKRSGPV
jgi:uncharacterized membrane protein YgaE (UPF0421/DUF939 family)